MRTTVFVAVFSALFLLSASERQQGELPNQDAGNIAEYYPIEGKFGWIPRYSRNSRLCQDDQDCFVGLMGRREVKMFPDRSGLNILKFLRELENRNLNPDYVE